MKNKKAKILIIEDDLMSSEALEEKFSREGFEVLKAEDGKKGIKLAFEERPDIILLDIIMPIMDGLTALKKLRANSKTKQIPIIMLSNLGDVDQMEVVKKQGVTDYLVKADSSMELIVEKVKDKLKFKK